MLLIVVVVVALNVAVVADAGTVTDAGTLKAVLLLLSDTLAPPVGAGCVRVTVQVLEEFGPRPEGLHDSEETTTDVAKLTVVLAVLLL